jgi:hypothetical protein
MDFEVYVPLAEDLPVKGHTVFTILVRSRAEGSWHFTDRYSSLLTKHKAILAACKKIKGMPSFPPKKAWGFRAPNFIEKRRLQLQTYFRDLI